MVAQRFVGAIGIAVFTVTLSAQTASPAEYRIKAAFLFNFMRFVQWPPTAFADERAPLVICVVGNDPFGAVLDQTLEGESVAARSIVARRVSDDESLDTCHLLFVSGSEKRRLGKVLQSVSRSAPVLTVSDIDGFVAGGGTIGFFLERNRVRFEIDPAQAQRHGLKLSSQLLGLGRIRQPRSEGGAS
ncbi:MAG TPA: YfiR family protein [Thermoanaerobaculia bacterium]